MKHPRIPTMKKHSNLFLSNSTKPSRPVAATQAVKSSSSKDKAQNQKNTRLTFMGGYLW